MRAARLNAYGDPSHFAREEAASLIATCKLSVPIAAIYPLRELKSALEHAQRGGKVLLRMTRG